MLKLTRLGGRSVYRRQVFLQMQLFRERLSDKVHATTPKGIVGGFEFTFFQRNLIEWQERPWTVCL